MRLTGLFTTVRRNRAQSRVFTKLMGETRTRTPSAPRRAHALAFAALCAVMVAAVAIPMAVASRAKVIGHTKHTPNPACPKSCSAIGKVTGFMTEADGKKGLFRIPKDGTIVGWAIDLGKPTKHDRNFFGELFRNKDFGEHPSGGIAILKRQSHHNYKLVKQSPMIDLKQTLGRKQIFTLNKPLRVRKGQVVALTVPTWASNFGINLNTDQNAWRASRKPSRCNVGRKHLANVKASRPQKKPGSIRKYGCLYRGTRLLYWAYFVPKGK
jgi:hypothetical protein